MKIKESLNVTFDETPPPSKISPLVDDDLDKEEAIKVTEKKNLENDIEDEILEIDEIVNIKESKNHPLYNVIRNLNPRTPRESGIIAMQEVLNQFIANDVWELVPKPKCTKIIGNKWVFRNKLDEIGIVSRNKAWLVAQGYNQQEGIDYDETYAPNQELLPETYWELLPKEILRASTQRDNRSYYPKRYWELLPKEILGCLMGKMVGASCTQRKVSMVPFVFSIPFVLSWGGSISSDSFLPSILLVVVIIVTVVIVAVILVVVVVVIVGVVIVIGVVVVGGVSFIIKLSFVIIGSLHWSVFCYLIH
ncbi:retrovirus-related pol polyprotein from transposon TNT 1-94 [Tanacetum coccineum]